MTPETVGPVSERIAVVIVSRNQRGALFPSLEALSTRPEEIRTIVVDLGSRDQSLDAEEAFPTTQFIKLPKNFGITKALNLGIRAANADNVLLMTEPFVVLAEDVVTMADRMDSDATIGGLVPRVPGWPQARPLPTPSSPDPAAREARTGEAVECASGPIMVRRFLLTSLQKIDERYGDYGSELELCMQVKRAGKRVVIADAHATRLASAIETDSLTTADRQLGTAAYIGKHHGFVTGILAHLKYLLRALFSFHLGRFRYLISGQKVDGKQ